MDGSTRSLGWLGGREARMESPGVAPAFSSSPQGSRAVLAEVGGLPQRPYGPLSVLAPPLSIPPCGPEACMGSFLLLSSRTVLDTVLATPAISAAPLLAQVTLTLTGTGRLLTEASGKQSDFQGETDPPLLVLNWWPLQGPGKPDGFSKQRSAEVGGVRRSPGGRVLDATRTQWGPPVGHPGTPTRYVGTTGGGSPVLHLSFSPFIEMITQISHFLF